MSYKMATHILGNFRGRCATKFHKELSNAKLPKRQKILVQRLRKAIENVKLSHVERFLKFATGED